MEQNLTQSCETLRIFPSRGLSTDLLGLDLPSAVTYDAVNAENAHVEWLLIHIKYILSQPEVATAIWKGYRE
jgi:hypothetical protein